MILGAGLAGVSAAGALRTEGFDGSITLVGDEPALPYDRPPLSKAYLRGESSTERIALKPAGFYETNGIELLLGGKATAIDTKRRRVTLSQADALEYDKLLIATGSRNRHLDIPGADLEGVYYLRTLAECDRIRSEITPGRSAAIVGMGFIGSEVASSLRQAGMEVTVVEPMQVPFERALGADIGRAIQRIHTDRGVKVRLGEGVSRFEGKGGVEAVVTASGESVACDFAVVGVGVRPAVELATQAGIEVDNGIVVDELCRTSGPDVFAAGDVTRHYHPLAGRHIRVEHWQNALKHGPAAARSMLGKAAPYEEVHWFWSDQYEFNIQYTGFHSEWDRFIVRGSIEENKFVAFYLESGRVAAALAINNGRDLRRAKELVRIGAEVDPAVLADPSADLRKVAA